MKRSFAALILLLVLCTSQAYAVGKELKPGTLMEPPEEVLSHIQDRWPHYDLEDYCEIDDTPKGDYGFALLRAGDERMLVGYHEDNGKMEYWLKNHGAAPQEPREAWFQVVPKGTTVYDVETGTSYLADGFSFGVTASDGELHDSFVSYHWEGGGFKLRGYHADWNRFQCNVIVRDNELHFSNWLEKEDYGTVYGEIQRDIRYVSFTALPATVEEARRELSVASHVKAGALEAKEIKFTGSRKYDVYTGPGERYARSGNGKGSVSTNDWIEVFGEEDGWIMIQYDVSADHFRIGWIEADALPDGADVAPLALGDANPYQEIVRACSLTDDPLRSETEVVYLNAGTQVYYLCNFGQWDYVEVEANGKLYRGFVPEICMTHG